MFYEISMVFFLILVRFFIITFLFWKILLTFCLCNFLMFRRWNKHCDVHFRHKRASHFRSKNGSTKEELDCKVFICRQSRHFSFVFIMKKVLFLTLYLDLACEQFFSHQGKGINRKKESSKEEILNITLNISWMYWLRKVVDSKESQFSL